jgi:hypothetical protein
LHVFNIKLTTLEDTGIVSTTDTGIHNYFWEAIYVGEQMKEVMGGLWEIRKESFYCSERIRGSIWDLW